MLRQPCHLTAIPPVSRSHLRPIPIRANVHPAHASPRAQHASHAPYAHSAPRAPLCVPHTHLVCSLCPTHPLPARPPHILIVVPLEAPLAHFVAPTHPCLRPRCALLAVPVIPRRRRALRPAVDACRQSLPMPEPSTTTTRQAYDATNPAFFRRPSVLHKNDLRHHD